MDYRQQYWPAAWHKAFAVATSGAHAWVIGAASEKQARQDALARCSQVQPTGGSTCRVVDVDGEPQDWLVFLNRAHMSLPSLVAAVGREGPANGVRSARTHRELLLNCFRAKKQISSGLIEGVNNEAKVTLRKACGNRTFRIAQRSLYHVLGRLAELKPAHRLF